jgi:zinc transport system substrate-binding protein
MTKTTGVMWRAGITLPLLAVLLVLGAGCQREVETRMSVVTSTTMIEAVVREIGGPAVAVEALVPGGMCPGHFDIKPRQMEKIERSDIFLYHGWEHWLPKVTQVTGLTTEIVGVDVEENWMVPDIHVEAIHVIRDILTSMAPDKGTYFAERALRYENAVLKESQSICESFRPYEGTPIMCSELQVDFLTWLGFDVVGSYGRSESMSPKTMENLITTGRRSNVGLVVDNKQSGPSVGSGIAGEIGARHVVLTNFPVDGSYLDALRSNVAALKDNLG